MKRLNSYLCDSSIIKQTSMKSLDYKECPQYGQRFLVQHPEVHFCGILNYISKMSNNLYNAHELKMMCSSYNPLNHPINAIIEDDSVYFKTGREMNVQFFGIHFNCIKVRPSAICIKTTNFKRPLKNQILRSFVIIGKDENQDYIPIQEFSNAIILKQHGREIFYINTDKYFNEMLIQQTSKSFDNERNFSILQFEIHGIIQITK